LPCHGKYRRRAKFLQNQPVVRRTRAFCSVRRRSPLFGSHSLDKPEDERNVVSLSKARRERVAGGFGLFIGRWMSDTHDGPALRTGAAAHAARSAGAVAALEPFVPGC
jgi:hypothetical protein